jgi:hypothetical protein
MYHPVRLAYQPPANRTFLSQQTSHQQSVSSTFLSEQISTSHQPPAKRTSCMPVLHSTLGYINNAEAHAGMEIGLQAMYPDRGILVLTSLLLEAFVSQSLAVLKKNYVRSQKL